MPVTLSVLELIAVELERRLKTLAVGSTYDTKLSEVIRPKRLETFTPKHLQVILTQGPSERIDELSYPGNPPAIAYRQTFNIRCHVMPSERSCEAVDKIINQMRADIISVVCTPQADWYQFDGQSIDAAFESEEPILSEGIDGINLPIAIVYRTDENDPYTRRA